MSTELAGVRYMCCFHCGVNYPSWYGSYCETNPNEHMVPCNEPNCEEGKEVYLGRDKEIVGGLSNVE